jgi:hypothetical protein
METCPEGKIRNSEETTSDSSIDIHNKQVRDVVRLSKQDRVYAD